jgi:hypothetical protein
MPIPIWSNLADIGIGNSPIDRSDTSAPASSAYLCVTEDLCAWTEEPILDKLAASVHQTLLQFRVLEWLYAMCSCAYETALIVK